MVSIPQSANLEFQSLSYDNLVMLKMCLVCFQGFSLSSCGSHYFCFDRYIIYKTSNTHHAGRWILGVLSPSAYMEVINDHIIQKIKILLIWYGINLENFLRSLKVSDCLNAAQPSLRLLV